MGIYDNFLSFGLSKKRLKSIAIIIVLAAAIIALYFAVSYLLQPKPIVASFSDNPLDLAKKPSTVLTVVVTNTTGETASNVVATVEAVAAENFVIFPAENTITTLGKGEFRELMFGIRPNPNTQIFSGDYVIKINVEMNGETFTQEIVLTVKAV